MKRRVFIQNLVLASGGLVLAGQPAFAAAATAEKKIKGTVTGQGKKLAGVAVSDGFSVVQTDKKGRYELALHEQARFVFISVPAGYHFPQQQSLTRHFLPLDNRQAYDFALTPLETDDTNHTFLIWADPQIKNATDVKMLMQQSVPDVQQLVKNLAPGTLVHGIGVGDLVWDNHDLFPKYNEAVAAMGIPFFQALGNHDMDYRQGGDETSDRTFQKHYGPSYYSFNRGKVHYIVLDDVRYLGSERTYDGHVSQQQLDWLRQDLRFVPKDHLVILSAHIPVAHVKNKAEVYALLEGYQAHIMTGHTHYNKNIIDQGIFEHNHGTVCGAWWTGPICSDGAPSGYGVYEVKGNQLSWYYKSTGLAASHQLSLHVETLTKQKRLIANVWNWDPAWKVEWWADGQYKGALSNSTGLDPLAVKLYKGDKLPERRTFAEPGRTDHLFVTHFPPEVKKIRLVATDRFGRQYQQEAEV
ncbi:MAG: calcineurin-like phosphoesterase C-terminal domain-containing protein [Adhaeribacter sp.]